MALFAQICLLLRKNLLLMGRNKLFTVLEFVIPLLLAPLLCLILYIMDKELKEEGRHIYEPLLVNGNGADFPRPEDMFSNSSRRTISEEYFYIGYSYEPGLKDAAEELMKKVAQRYGDGNETNGRRLEITAFPNIEEMKLTVNRSEYFGGIYFTGIQRGSHQSGPGLEYRILMSSKSSLSSLLSSFWLGDDPSDLYSDSDQMPQIPPYWDSGFLSIQHAIEMSFLEMEGVKGLDKIDVSFLRMPMDKIQDKGPVMLLKVVDVFWMLAIIAIMLFMAKNVLIEKEAGIRTYMSVMGLNQMAFYYSHIIIGAIKSTIILSICSAIFSYYLLYASSVLFILHSILFGIAMLHFAVLTTTIVPTHQMNQFVLMAASLVLLVLSINAKPPSDSIGFCLLASINPVAAFQLGIDHLANYERKVHYFGIGSLFAGRQFTMGLAMLMLIFDSLLFTLLFNYMDAVVPTDDSPRKHPLFFLMFGGCKKKHENMVEDFENGPTPNEDMETENGAVGEANIDVRHMSKQWGSGKGAKLAVNDLNFKARKGQLTVLLGPNGAGKTTTFSILTGSISASSGQVLICGKDMKENLRECQKMIGYCPQHNPLFERLTVNEHLHLYAGLKSGTFNGPHGKKVLEKEISALLHSVGLFPKKYQWASKLSGGQKRKLCVAIALVGDSQVVLLDEPTAGMDPEARSEIGRLLTKAKGDRTILLTTHYMGEADTLGDNIGIMVDGRLKCNGSPEFLKNRFGAGYILSVVCDEFDDNNSIQAGNSIANHQKMDAFNSAIDRILCVIRQHSANARIERAQSPPQFSIILPVSDKRRYANLFEELERRKMELGIRSFGLSLNTLEQVFLKVGEQSENGDDIGGKDAQTQQFAKELFGPSRHKKDFTKIGLFFRQIAALLCRQALWVLRNPFRSFTPLALAVIFFIFIGLIAKPEPSTISRSLSLDTVDEYVKIPLQVKADQFRAQFDGLSDRLCKKCRLIKLDSNAELEDELLKWFFEMPPQMVAGAGVSENGGRTQINALFNAIAVHSPPMALSFVANALLGANSFAIRPSIEIFHTESESKSLEKANMVEEKNLYNVMVAVAIILFFSVFSASMVVPLVEEKAGKFKHQLMLTKLNVGTYWTSIYTWNLLVYFVFCAIIMAFILAFGWMEGYRAKLCLIWLLYFCSYVPLNAVLSFIFGSPQKAFTLVFVSNMFFSILLIMLTNVIHLLLGLFEIDSNTLPDLLGAIGFLILPTYGLGAGVFQILTTSRRKEESESNLHIWMMIASGILFSTILAILESRWIATKIRHLCFRQFREEIYHSMEIEAEQQPQDPDVLTERERVERREDTELALAVRKLVKYYGHVPALRGITFGVEKEECFGLLGVNGAGKTTTFDILTGVNFSTLGRASISGKDVNKAPSFGYCPQFDVLPLELTGREVLTLIGWLNGYGDMKERVKKILSCIQMETEADRKVKQYSGGQRRRISVGVTLLTRSSLIMLDEPTAGIDPITRHQIWKLLSAIRQQGIAILLTSHSMDECEELCSKIAFMNRGALIGVGSSQHLKTRFGNSYLLTISISNPSAAIHEQLNTIVMGTFDALPTNDAPTSSTLHWEVPKRENMPWSWLYSKAQELADSYQQAEPENDRPIILDFSLTQNSLEQVFLRLSKIGKAAAISALINCGA